MNMNEKKAKEIIHKTERETETKVKDSNSGSIFSRILTRTLYSAVAGTILGGTYAIIKKYPKRTYLLGSFVIAGNLGTFYFGSYEYISYLRENQRDLKTGVYTGLITGGLFGFLLHGFKFAGLTALGWTGASVSTWYGIKMYEIYCNKKEETKTKTFTIQDRLDQMHREKTNDINLDNVIVKYRMDDKTIEKAIEQRKEELLHNINSSTSNSKSKTNQTDTQNHKSLKEE